MKKRILILLIPLLFVYSVFSANITTTDGCACAQYMGSTENTSLQDEYNNLRRECSATLDFYEYSGKLSKKESRLLWAALNLFDYREGEIYWVTIYRDLNFIYMLVQIEPGDSCTFLSWTASLK